MNDSGSRTSAWPYLAARDTAERVELGVEDLKTAVDSLPRSAWTA